MQRNYNFVASKFNQLNSCQAQRRLKYEFQK